MAVCSRCNGTGIVSDPPTGNMTCPNCEGVGKTPLQILEEKIDDVIDRCNDILNKCNDILGALP